MSTGHYLDSLKLFTPEFLEFLNKLRFMGGVFSRSIDSGIPMNGEIV